MNGISCSYGNTVNTLPSRLKLHQKFSIEDLSCPICGTQTEDIHRLLLNCPIMILIWRNSKWKIRLKSFSHMTVNEWIQFVGDRQNNLPLNIAEKEEMLNFLVVAFEQVWIRRNSIIHNRSSRFGKMPVYKLIGATRK